MFNLFSGGASGKFKQALISSDLKSIRKLIKQDSLNAKNELMLDGVKMSPLFYAIYKNNLSLVIELIKSGADVNEVSKSTTFENFTPLLYASSRLNHEISLELIKNGADQSAAIFSNGLVYAVVGTLLYENNHDLFSKYLEAGLNLNIRLSTIDTTCFLHGLPLVALPIATEQPEKFELLFEFDIDINATINNKNLIYHEYTPIMLAIYTRNFDAFRRLLYNGADLLYTTSRNVNIDGLLNFSKDEVHQKMKNLLVEFGHKSETTTQLDSSQSLYEETPIEDKGTSNEIQNKKLNPTNLHNINLEDALLKLDDIIGLQSVKDNLKGIVNSIRIEKLRNRGKDIVAGHYIFTGNPGTGKTTIARLMGEVLNGLGLLEQGHFIEVTREDLVAGYIGQTAIKTREKLEEALGGILFIDEAYSLSKGGDNDFGKEAIDTIVPFMENNREKFTLIIAGYNKEMDEFLDSNTGLKSRFTNSLQFDDYSNKEMIEIFRVFVEKDGFKLEDGVEDKLINIFQNIRNNSNHFGNGRDVRKVYEEACNNLDDRLVTLSDLTEGDERLFLITCDDITDSV